MKKKINYCIMLLLVFISILPAAGKIKNAAIIESFSGNIIIKQNNVQVKPAQYTYLVSGCHVIVPEGSRLTIIMYNGKKIDFNRPAEFEINQNNEIIPINGATAELIENGTTRIHTGGTRSKPVPDVIPETLGEDLKEIDEKITDPIMNLLYKINYYETHEMKNKSTETYKEYKKMLKELKTDEN